MGGSGDETTATRAADGGAEKSAYLKDAFSRIAPRYDLLNHLLSLNIDRTWRRSAISALAVERKPYGTYLDLCAGTLDVSVALANAAAFKGRIAAVDFAEPMLRAGTSKIRGKAIAPVVADALALPLASSSVTGAIVAFGIRNVADLHSALTEVHRVLEPGGKLVILEFSTPRSTLVNAAYQLYFRRVLPLIGGMISGHPTAYRYLPRSVANFPVMQELARRMHAAGFSRIEWRSVSFGIAAIHVAER